VGPVVAMTVTLAAVYTPIAFQGGLTGALFREFALTLAGAVAISGVVALTLSPVMSAALLRGDRQEQGLAGRINRGFDRIRTSTPCGSSGRSGRAGPPTPPGPW